MLYIYIYEEQYIIIIYVLLENKRNNWLSLYSVFTLYKYTIYTYKHLNKQGWTQGGGGRSSAPLWRSQGVGNTPNIRNRYILFLFFTYFDFLDDIFWHFCVPILFFMCLFLPLKTFPPLAEILWHPCIQTNETNEPYDIILLYF